MSKNLMQVVQIGIKTKKGLLFKAVFNGPVQVDEKDFEGITEVKFAIKELPDGIKMESLKESSHYDYQLDN